MLGKKVLIGFILMFIFTVNGCCKLPSYSPGYWNNSSTTKWNNNCYNYGNNKRTDTYAQPGRAAGIILTQDDDMYCAAVTDAAVADGIEKAPISGICPDTLDKIALVIAPKWDYHWYRQDSSGMWSHKPGQQEATNLDNVGNPIVNPETASRGAYSVFCGYFCSCSDDDQGQGHENIN